MKILHIIRHNDWWEVKLPPLLAIAFGTLLIHQKNIFEYGSSIIWIILSVTVGAVYVSLINDVTDIDMDMAAGKNNRMMALPKYMRALLPFLFISAGVGFLIFLYKPHTLSMLLYTLPWISFSLYSFRPVRLKERDIAGVLADASGSHIFISLLMVSFLSYLSGQPIQVYWFAATGVWALCYGIRGILWHQFSDRNNDLESHIKTFATVRKPQDFKKYERLILALEIAALLCMLYILHLWLPLLALVFYAGVAVIRYKKLGMYPVIILVPPHKYGQILLLDYYQAVLPLSLLVYSCCTQKNGWIVLLVYVLLFPKTPYRIVRDFLLVSKSGKP